MHWMSEKYRRREAREFREGVAKKLAARASLRAKARDRIDMRHDKYLSSHQRSMRRLAWSLSHPNKAEPKEWTAPPKAIEPQPIKTQRPPREAASYRGCSGSHKERMIVRRKKQLALAPTRQRRLFHNHSYLYAPNGKRECARRVRQMQKAAR